MLHQNISRITSARIEPLEARQFLSAGSLDPTFGHQGIVNLGPPQLTAVAVQSDGKIISAGDLPTPSSDLGITRFDADGTIDKKYGVNGMLVLPVQVNAATVQADGKLLVIGGQFDKTDHYVVVVARVTSGGKLDKTFGGGTGKFTFRAGEYADGLSIALSGTKIVVRGDVLTGNNYSVLLLRLHGDGTLDKSFNGSGSVLLKTDQLDFYHDVAVLSDGHITTVLSTLNSARVVRYTAAGKLDRSFGHDGISDRAVLLEPELIPNADGSFFLAGTPKPFYSDSELELVRYTRHGAIDKSFGTRGVITVPVPNFVTLTKVIPQPDTSVVLVGDIVPPNETTESSKVFIAKLGRDKRIDPLFGTSGITIFSSGYGDQSMTALETPGPKVLIDVLDFSKSSFEGESGEYVRLLLA